VTSTQDDDAMCSLTHARGRHDSSFGTAAPTALETSVKRLPVFVK
jgi:hypothetical protein